VTDAPQLAADYQLACSPNPCNPATEINFRLDSPARVNLAIYNLRGRLLWMLTEAPFAAGAHSVRWEPHVASGIYLVRLSSGNTAETVKVSVAK